MVLLCASYTSKLFCSVTFYNCWMKIWSNYNIIKKSNLNWVYSFAQSGFSSQNRYPIPPPSSHKNEKEKKIEIWKLKCFNKGFESSNSSCGVTLSHSIHWYNETPYYKGSSLNSIYNLKSRASAKQILHF